MTTAQGTQLTDEELAELEELGEAGDDDSDLVKRLRTQVKNLTKKVSTGDKALTARAEKAERELLVHKAGLADLSDSRVTALLAAIGDGDVTPESVQHQAVEFGWLSPDQVTATPSGEVTDEARASAEAQARMSQHAAGAQAPGQSGVLKAADVAEWTHEQRQAFIAAHKEDYERLMRGEEIARPQGF